MDLSLVVQPGDAEHDDTFRLHHPLKDLGGTVLRVPVEHDDERLDDFLYSLVELRLCGVLGLDMCDEILDVLGHTFSCLTL